MDELRQELEAEGGKGWVTGTIDWLSAAANAAASAASPLQAAYQALLRIGPQPSSSTSSGMEHDNGSDEDPAILFEPLDSLEAGLRRMRELWPGLTPAALADSEPLHLSLAVKALGLNGPPKGF